MTLMQKLITWQQQQSRKEHLEPYMVLQFNTIKEIVRLQPKTHNDLIKIKGIGPAKVRKYGDALISIVRGNGIVEDMASTDGNSLFVEANTVNDAVLTSENPISQDLHYDNETGEIIDSADDAVTVTEFVSMLDTMLQTNFRSVRVQGEIVGFKQNASGHVYFEIKDKESVLRCAVFRGSYDLSGVALEDGMEIIVTGHPNYHKKYGFSFIGETVELCGEGALKKAYDDLKKKLETEGLFASSRKRLVPQFPERIGLITSRTGAAIGDFTSNVGQYGYKILFHHTSVEGAHALGEIKRALEVMATKDIDVLVMVRGGGSLESLQAFNNEKIVRMITEFPVPVIVGIGHEQDETITTLAADVGASTPTAAAHSVRASWDACGDYVRTWEVNLLQNFDTILRTHREHIAHSERQLVRYFENIIVHFHGVFHRFALATQRIDRGIVHAQAHLRAGQRRITDVYAMCLHRTGDMLTTVSFINQYKMSIMHSVQKLQFFEKTIAQYDPHRQLARGYSITTNAEGHIIRSIRDVHKNDDIIVRVGDGKIYTKTIKLTKEK